MTVQTARSRMNIWKPIFQQGELGVQDLSLIWLNNYE